MISTRLLLQRFTIKILICYQFASVPLPFLPVAAAANSSIGYSGSVAVNSVGLHGPYVAAFVDVIALLDLVVATATIAAAVACNCW